MKRPSIFKRIVPLIITTLLISVVIHAQAETTVRYGSEDNWTVILTIDGPGGKSIQSKVWDVTTK